MGYCIKVEDEKVVLTLTATTGWTFDFSHNAGHKAWAELLAESLRRQRSEYDATEAKRLYEMGWADAKAKRTKLYQ